MTEGQVRYQQVAESIRHNREMERIDSRKARTGEREVTIKEKLEPFQRELLNRQAVTEFFQPLYGGLKGYSDLGKGYASIFEAIGSLFK